MFRQAALGYDLIHLRVRLCQPRRCSVEIQLARYISLEPILNEREQLSPMCQRITQKMMLYIQAS